MSVQDNSVDAIGQIFGSPLVKGILAALTVFAAIVRYIKDSGQRRERAAEVATTYGMTGRTFWTVNRFPHLLHQIIAFGVLAAAVVEILILADQYALGGSIFSVMPRPVEWVAQFLSDYFVWLFLAALGFYVLFELRWVELSLAWVLGLVPSIRNSLEWANARWQIRSDDEFRLILAPADSGVEKSANRIIDELTAGRRNDRLALRPASLSEDSAANILYFGHAFEQYLSQVGGSMPWTAFYQALGDVAKDETQPFSAAAIAGMAANGSFLSVLRRANSKLDEAWQISNDAGLEAAVEKAAKVLRSRWASDARNLGKGRFGNSYQRVLRESRHFLSKEGMRRQFAKLFILWGLVPDATRPKVFKIPFNDKMFIHYLDEDVIRSKGKRFDTRSEAVQICFEAVQMMIVTRVLEFLTETRDDKRTAWRDAEKADVESRGIDWTWWVYYRADQQAYNDARDHESTKWKVEADQDVVPAV